MIGVSEGERKFLGDKQISALIKSFYDEGGISVYLNADHTHTLESAVGAAKAGFHSIVFDLSALPIEENIRQTREALEVLKGINPSILIEREIGDIGTGSNIHEVAPDLSKGMTTPDQAEQFVEATGVDRRTVCASRLEAFRQAVRTAPDGSVPGAAGDIRRHYEACRSTSRRWVHPAGLGE